MKARARITRTEGTYDLLLSTDQQGRVGKRAISATNCRELAEVTAALLSLSLQAAPRSPPPAETARPESGGHSANRPSPGAAPFLDVGALTGVGILPKPSVGPAIRLGARFESVQIELGGYALLPAVAAVDASVSSRHSLLSFAVRICRTWGESWILGPCAGMQIGVLRGEALGVTNPAKAGKPWLSPEVGILAGISEGSWSLVIRPALGTALVRPRFRIEPYGTTFQPGVVFFSGEIYLRVSFGTYP
jgi:hypothetical protein